MLTTPYVKPNFSIKEALKVIDEGAIKMAFVVDEEHRLLGTVSDGDIRRAILKGKSLEDTIQTIYNERPLFAPVQSPKKELADLAILHGVTHIPLVDEAGHLVDIFSLQEYIVSQERSNWVVFMVGGLGTRLRPLTDKCPKPLLEVGGKPILETSLRMFKKYGFKKFIFCINYKAQMIKDYFGDGSDFGVEIEYVHENERMGTAGALTLLPERPKEPFFVINGDILTTVDFGYMLEYHLKNRAFATMGVREYEYQIPFGVVNLRGNEIRSIEEKPVYRFFVNAGIYILDPGAIDYIPKNSFFDMPELFGKLNDAGKSSIAFPIKEYWLDIGNPKDFQRAQKEFSKVFNV